VPTGPQARRELLGVAPRQVVQHGGSSVPQRVRARGLALLEGHGQRPALTEPDEPTSNL